MRKTLLPIAALMLTAGPLCAQTVYRCESGKSVTYSHEPCVGGKAVDVTPTQGMDTWSGVRRRSLEMQIRESRILMDKALQPLTGMTSSQMDTQRRRYQLPASDKPECSRLDDGLVGASAAPKSQEVDEQLFQFRRRYRELRC